MKIAFDLDGTAWRYPEILREFARGMQAAGHQVGVLTGHRDDIREADLNLWRARGFPGLDFFLNASDADRRGIKLHNRAPVEWKLDLARAEQVTVLIDDFDGYFGTTIAMVML